MEVCFFSTDDGMNDNRGFMSVAPVLRLALPRLCSFGMSGTRSFLVGGDEIETLN